MALEFISSKHAEENQRVPYIRVKILANFSLVSVLISTPDPYRSRVTCCKEQQASFFSGPLSSYRQ